MGDATRQGVQKRSINSGWHDDCHLWPKGPSRSHYSTCWSNWRQVTRGSVASYCDRIVDQYQPTQCPEAAPPAPNDPDAGCNGDDILARHPSLNPDALQHFGLTQTGHCMGGSHLHWMVHLPATSSMLLLMGAGNLASAKQSHAPLIGLYGLFNLAQV